MSESLDVYMDGEIIGCLSSGSGQVTFSYDSEYGGVVPLSLSMPLRRRKHSNKAVLPFIWGLLPDNEQALRNMASEAGTSAKSPFGILRVHGADVAGALQILPPGVESSDARRKSVDNAEDILDDKALEELMLHTLDRYTQRRPDYGEAFKFSIAGAQPKIALSANTSGDFVVPSKDFATTHIVKPNYIDSDYFISDVEATEMVSLGAAALCGMRTSQTSLWTSPSGNIRALIVKRYDRYVSADGLVHRLHQEDLCQALSVLPEKKYQHRHGGPGIGAIGQLIRSAVPREDRVHVGEDFFRALVFNVGILGTDAHAKNYSLLLDSRVSLSPLYDVISAAAHIGPDTPAYFPMKVGDTYELSSITPEALAKEGAKVGLNPDASDEIVRDVLGKIPQAVEHAARQVGREDIADRLLEGIERYSPVRWVNAA